MSNLINKIDSIIDLLNKEMINAEKVGMKVLIAKFTERIFNRGSASDETRIGNYSKKPIYIQANNFIKGVPIGAVKSGKNKGLYKKGPNKGNRVKGQYFKGGYYEFRKSQGFQTAFVDLELRGDLFRSIIIAEYNGHFVLGFNSIEQSKKAQGLEKHFKKTVFYPTNEEIAQAKEAASDYLKSKSLDLFNTW